MPSAGWSVLRRASKSIATSVASTRAQDIGAEAPLQRQRHRDLRRSHKKAEGVGAIALPIHAVAIARCGACFGAGIRCPQARPMHCNASGAKCSSRLQCSVELLRRTGPACSSAHIAKMARMLREAGTPHQCGDTVAFKPHDAEFGHPWGSAVHVTTSHH